MAVALFAFIAAAAYGVLRAQLRFYARHALVGDVRTAAGVASRVLAAELRAASPDAGDLYAIGPDSVALRSTTGVGFVCAVQGTTLGLWSVHGVFGTLSTDSLMVFLEGDPMLRADDSWVGARILSVAGGNEGACPGGRPSELEVTLETDLTGVTAGVPVRSFRPYVYRIYRGSDGLWWLGRRLRYGSIQPVAGPLASPEDGGLLLEWTEPSGGPAGGPETVVAARVSVVSVSPVPHPTGAGLHRETFRLSTRAYLRNASR